MAGQRPRAPAALPQFEDVLYAIFASAAAFPAAADTSAVGALVTAKKLPDVLVGGHGRAAGRDTLRELGGASVDALVDAFRDLCRAAVASRATEFSRLREFVDALATNSRSRSRPSTTTTSSTGRSPESRPGSIPAPAPSGRAGSSPGPAGLACFTCTGPSTSTWCPRSATCTKSAGSRTSAAASIRLPGAEAPALTSRADFPTSIVVAGYGKTTQILRRPFRTYYWELDRLVADCDSVLFAGYGFGDAHLNIAFEGFRDARLRPVAVIGHAPDDAMALGSMDLGDYDPGREALVQTFETDWKSMLSLGSSGPDTVEASKPAYEFEVCGDPKTPLSFWYNGMMAACAHPEKVLAQLR